MFVGDVPGWTCRDNLLACLLLLVHHSSTTHPSNCLHCSLRNSRRMTMNLQCGHSEVPSRYQTVSIPVHDSVHVRSKHEGAPPCPFVLEVAVGLN
ncbi:hypothetical protein PENSPDRAFT_65106 [Peniophora sp. CONT]|nr:hypothetical protein PENSPDRAFT_65106 [Peniophora sp. CONT]